MPQHLPSPQVDPQAQRLLTMLAASSQPPVHTLSPEQARASYRERALLTQPEPPVLAQVQDLLAPTAQGPLALRLYRPAQAPNPTPTLIFLHGGGWVIGDLETHDTLCRELAQQSGCAVLAVDYRLGPTHKFPAAVDDALAAVRWVRSQAQPLGLDATRLAIGGDSAGGNLAAVTCLLLKEAGELQGLRWQLLIYPATDMRGLTESHRRCGEGYLLTSASMAYYQAHYLAHPDQVHDWRASPLRHPDLSGLPPALVLTAGFDPLRDDGRAYADALTLAGTPAQMVCFERQIHGFILMGGVLDEACTAVSLCALSLRQALAR